MSRTVDMTFQGGGTGGAPVAAAPQFAVPAGLGSWVGVMAISQ
jgi:hypothetical protein